MRRTCRYFALFLAMFFAGTGLRPAVAQNQAFEAAEKTPASVHSAASGGYWSAGSDEGFFRAIVISAGVEHVAHRLYIQWLKNDTKTQTYNLIRTVNVKELNLGQGHVLEIVTSFGDVNAFQIAVTANTRGGEAKRYAITARGSGGYTIQGQ